MNSPENGSNIPPKNRLSEATGQFPSEDSQRVLKQETLFTGDKTEHEVAKHKATGPQTGAHRNNIGEGQRAAHQRRKSRGY